jgi:membrane-associated protease RseP (regulator of RpoE activity)
MKSNVGGIDKIARIVIGVALVVLAAMGQIGVWGYIGIVPILTGLMNFCPLYPLLGINTCGLTKNA